jgi:hypothetical protein
LLFLRRILQVEALVGRSPISAAALGHHHSLFLDQGEQQQQQQQQEAAGNKRSALQGMMQQWQLLWMWGTATCTGRCFSEALACSQCS